MRISCLVFVVMGGALTLGASIALASSTAPQRLEGAASTVPTGKRRIQHRTAKANQVPKPPHVANKNRLKRLANGPAKATSAVPGSAHKSGANQPVMITKKGSIQNKPVTSVFGVQRPNMFPSSSPSLDHLRHRGPNPAVIGGLGSSKLRETGAIDGSHVRRRP